MSLNVYNYQLLANHNMINYCNNLTLKLNGDAANMDSGNYTFYNRLNLQQCNLVNFGGNKILNATFALCHNLQNINAFNGNLSKINSLHMCFYECYNLTNLDVKNGNTDLIYDGSATFGYCTHLQSLEVNDGNMQNVKSLNQMFMFCSNLTNLNVSNGDMSNVKNLGSAFTNCSKLTTLDVSNGNISNVNYLSYTFANCNNLINLDVSNGNTSKVNTMVSTFRCCNNLTTLNISNGNTSNLNNLASTFGYLYKVQNLDVSNGNVNKLINLFATFYSCNNLISLNMSNGKTNNVSTLGNTFCYCSKLQNLDIASWNVDNVKSLSHTFAYCRKLTTLNLSNGHTNNVNNFVNTFSDCPNITSLNLANGNVDKAISLAGMMNGCNNLTNLNIGIGNINNANNISKVFSNTGKRGNAEQDVYGLDFNGVLNGNMNNIVNMSNFLNNTKCGYFPLYNINNIQPYISTGLPNIYGNTDNVTDISGAFSFESARPKSAEDQPNLYVDGDTYGTSMYNNTIHTNGFFNFNKIKNAVGTFSANSIYLGYGYDDSPSDFGTPLTGGDYGLYLNNTENVVNVKNMFASDYNGGEVPFYYDTYSDAPTFNIQNIILNFNNVSDASYLFYNYQPVSDHTYSYEEGESYIFPRKILPTLILNNIVNLAYAYYNTRTPIIDTTYGNLSKVTNIKCMFSQSYALDNNSLKNIANALLTATKVPATQKNLFINNTYGPFNQITDVHEGMAVPKIINNATVGTTLVSQLRAAGGSVPE